MPQMIRPKQLKRESQLLALEHLHTHLVTMSEMERPDT
jgi:hypothetical protein